MRVIIAGSRGIMHRSVVEQAVQAAGFPITEVVSGGARGVDSLAFDWAMEHGYPVKRFLPDWKTYSRAAGPIRNKQMAEYADALIAVWDGESPGTAHMIKTATEYGLKVYVHRNQRQSQKARGLNDERTRER